MLTLTKSINTFNNPIAREVSRNVAIYLTERKKDFLRSIKQCGDDSTNNLTDHI